MAAVLAWLGPQPVPAARLNARWAKKMHRTLLMEACYEAHEELIVILLDLGADVNIGSLSGQTALCQACTYLRLDGVARLLLRRGASTAVLPRAPVFRGRKWVLNVRNWPSQNGVFGFLGKYTVLYTPCQ